KQPKKNLRQTIYLTAVNTHNYEEVDYELLKIQLGEREENTQEPDRDLRTCARHLPFVDLPPLVNLLLRFVGTVMVACQQGKTHHLTPAMFYPCVDLGKTIVNENTLSYKTKLVFCTIFLHPDGSSDNRDDLAKTLYSIHFAWLNEHINQPLCRDDFDTFTGLFDLPGPQNMMGRSNSLDQFCINFVNERLHHFIQQRLFESHVNEYQSEGISKYVPPISYFDNSECVRLFQNKPGGLIHIMDNQAHRSHKKTDHTMVEAFAKRWGNHSSFKLGGGLDRSGFPPFTVCHFNGPVTYSSEAFLERNLDALNPDFVALLRRTTTGAGLGDGAEGAGSINPFIKGLFSGKAIATQAHPKSEDMIVAAQQPVKPMHAPSTHRENTVHHMPRNNAATGTTPPIVKEEHEDEDIATSQNTGTLCVAGEFHTALDTLFDTLGDMHNWFMFCINPNDSPQLLNQLKGRLVKGQVCSSGLVEVAKRNACVFEVGMTLDEFCQRYRDPMSKVQPNISPLPIPQRHLHLTLCHPLPRFPLHPHPHLIFHHSRYPRGISILLYIIHFPGFLHTCTHTRWCQRSIRKNRLHLLQIFLSQPAFHALEDYLRAADVEEQKRNWMREAEVEAGLIFHKKDREGLVPKETLPGEILEGETTEIVEELSAQ
ncbi:P-loop containing nucleoside triphosphate hydrolase protein, partial [Pisolithus tinctorius]